MKTQEQIVQRIKQIENRDFFGFETETLIAFLDFEHAKEFLKEGVKADEWKSEALSADSILKTMRDYMDFAWEKANNCRGISAGRSMSHYSAWIWALGDEDKFGNLKDYSHYGKENLIRICQHYGWPSEKWDDGVRVNTDTGE